MLFEFNDIFNQIVDPSLEDYNIVDGVLRLHLDPNVLNDCSEVPKVWLRGDEAFLAWGEEEVPHGDGEEHEGVQGGEA